MLKAALNTRIRSSCYLSVIYYWPQTTPNMEICKIKMHLKYKFFIIITIVCAFVQSMLWSLTDKFISKFQYGNWRIHQVWWFCCRWFFNKGTKIAGFKDRFFQLIWSSIHPLIRESSIHIFKSCYSKQKACTMFFHDLNTCKTITILNFHNSNWWVSAKYGAE